MYYIDIIILSIIILIIVILIYDVYKKNIKIIKKIEMFNEFDYHKLGPIKFIDKDDQSHVLGYFPNGQGENGNLSAEQEEIIRAKELSMTTIRIPRGTAGAKGDTGTQGPVGDQGPQGADGKKFTGPPGDNGSPAPSCRDGIDAPACVPAPAPGTPGGAQHGQDAEPCGPSPIGPPGTPALPCEEGDKGPDGVPADPCVQSPACEDGADADPCTCVCATCAPAQCVNTVKLKEINGNNLEINTENVDIYRTLNMNDASKICIGNSCIDKDIIDKINKI